MGSAITGPLYERVDAALGAAAYVTSRRGGKGEEEKREEGEDE